MDIQSKIHIRNATVDDVPFVAGCVLAAVGLYAFRMPSSEQQTAEKVCSRPDTLYSYKNARIVEIEGVSIGCIVSYDGASYEEARRITYSIFDQEGHSMPHTDVETFPGEWYLDTMAIVPAYRGYGIGKLLMQDAIRIAKEKGHNKVSLIVDSGNPRLQAYYASLGFVAERELQAFDHTYTRMVL